MTTQKTKEKYSRKEARQTMRQLYPNLLTSTDVVHHIDLNPLNNNLNNLIIIDRQEHKILHCGLNKKSRLKELNILLLQK